MRDNRGDRFFYRRIVERPLGYDLTTGDYLLSFKRGHGPRGLCGGWTWAVVTRLVKFLQRIIAEALFDGGLVVTGSLTYGRGGRDDDGLPIPAFRPSPARVAADITALKRFLQRSLGSDLGHWLIEFQRASWPHIHFVARFPSGACGGDADALTLAVREWWVRRTSDYGSRLEGQAVGLMHDLVGWSKYLDKHAARNSKHYQRSSVPHCWDGNTRRMCGKWGKWVLGDVEIDECSLGDEKRWYDMRRIKLRLKLIAHARRRPFFPHGDSMGAVAYEEVLKYRRRLAKWERTYRYLKNYLRPRGCPAWYIREFVKAHAGAYQRGEYGDDCDLTAWAYRAWSKQRSLHGWITE